MALLKIAGSFDTGLSIADSLPGEDEIGDHDSTRGASILDIAPQQIADLLAEPDQLPPEPVEDEKGDDPVDDADRVAADTPLASEPPKIIRPSYAPSGHTWAAGRDGKVRMSVRPPGGESGALAVAVQSPHAPISEMNTGGPIGLRVAKHGHKPICS